MREYNKVDLSDKIRQNEEEILPLKEIAGEMELMERYNGADRVVPFIDIMEVARLRDAGTGEKVITRIPRLDYLTDGFRPGQVVVLSAPTGEGKTAFLQHLTTEFQDQAKCLWFSYEVPPEEFEERFQGNVPYFFVPGYNKESNLEWLRQRIIEGVAKHNTRVVFIDHLHYLLDMKLLAMSRGNTSLVIGVLMRELKKIAIRYSVIIFLVSHLTKTKMEAVLQIDDLRDSSFVGQEADIVMIMWRIMQKDKKTKTITATNESCLSVAKNRRNGRIGVVKMMYNQGRFLEIDTQHEGL